MGPIWGRQDPGGPHAGPMNFVIWVFNLYIIFCELMYLLCYSSVMIDSSSSLTLIIVHMEILLIPCMWQYSTRSLQPFKKKHPINKNVLKKT